MAILFTAAIAVSVAAPSVPSAIAYYKFRQGTQVFHAVQADLNSGRITTKTALTDGLESPWSFVASHQPDVMLTGTFFAPQNGIPVADVLVDGHLEARGNRGTVLAVGHDGSIQIHDRAFRRSFDWEGFKYGLRGGVRLVKDGKVIPNPKAQSFSDPRIWGRAARTGVGLTKHGKLLFLATKHPVTLSEFGRAMTSRGVLDAVSLDGGGSTLLYYRGEMKVSTQRKLSNVLVLHEQPL